MGFTPPAAATYGGTVTVSGNHTTGTNTIAISGTGAAPASRVIALSGTLAFGSVGVGTSATRALRISNTGNSTLTVTGLGCPPGFSGAFSGTIAAGAFRDVTVTFAPTAVTLYGGVVTVIADQTNGGAQISITGTGTPTPVTLSVSPAALNYGAIKAPGGTLGPTTPAQRVRVTQFGSGSVTWTATANQPWLQITPASGTGSGSFTVSVTGAVGLLAPGTVSGTVTVHATGAQNEPVIPVSLSLSAPSTSAAPFGVLDTPPNGTTGVTGSIAVTGWALDDVAVARVRVVRDPVAGEPAGLVFIGDAVLVDGARPDVAAAFRTAPLNARAGWGYLMLTNFLPKRRQRDVPSSMRSPTTSDGHSVELGKRTITCTKATATEPFGAIDTPGQGRDRQRRRITANFGWVLAHAPSLTYPPFGERAGRGGRHLPAGLAIRLGPAVRSDSPCSPRSATLASRTRWPRTTLDTTALADGVHTIAWIVRPTTGRRAGSAAGSSPSPTALDPRSSERDRRRRA